MTRIKVIVERLREMGQQYSRLDHVLSGVWENAHAISEAAEHVVRVLPALESPYSPEMEAEFDQAYSDAARLKLIAHDLNTMSVQLATCLDIVKRAQAAAERMPGDHEAMAKLKAAGWTPTQLLPIFRRGSEDAE